MTGERETFVAPSAGVTVIEFVAIGGIVVKDHRILLFRVVYNIVLIFVRT